MASKMQPQHAVTGLSKDRLAAYQLALREEQQAHLQTQQRLRTLLDFAPEAIVFLDVATEKFLDANPAAESLFGLTRRELLRLGPFDLSPHEQPDGSSASTGREKVAEAIAGGTPVFEWWHCNAKGERFPCEVRLVRIPWGNQDVIRGSITDISARKQLELVTRGRSQVLEKIALGATLSEVLHLLVRTTEKILPGMTCSVLLLDQDRKLRVHAAPGLPDFYNDAVDGLAIGPRVGSCGAAAALGRRVIVHDVLDHPNWSAFRPIMKRVGLRACWSEPIFSLDGNVLGTFAMYYHEPRVPISLELSVIEFAAQLAAIAVEHHRHRQLLQEVNESLEFRVAAQSTELDRAAHELQLADAERRLAAVAFETHDSIMIMDADGRILKVNESFCELTGYQPEEVIGQLPVFLRSARHDRDFYRQMWQQIRDNGYWEGEIWSRRKNGEVFPQRLTINAVRNETGEVTHFVGDGQDLTEEKRAAHQQMAIDVARRVQHSLFPSRMPTVPGFDIAGAAFPAEHVSGDYYDFIRLPDDSLALLVADVSGHGLGPALLMAQAQAYLRAIAETYHDPGELLRHANRLLARTDTEHFVTLFLAHLEPSRSQFTYAAAGHRGYLLRRDDSIVQLESTGIPLGISPQVEFSTSPSYELAPGDILVLPTDGIVEARGTDRAFFGEQRLLDVVRAHRTESASSIVRELYAAARTFTHGQAQKDDITVVIAKAN